MLKICRDFQILKFVGLLKYRSPSDFWNAKVCLDFKMLKFGRLLKCRNLFGFWNAQVYSNFEMSKFDRLLKCPNLSDFWNIKIHLTFEMPNFFFCNAKICLAFKISKCVWVINFWSAQIYLNFKMRKYSKISFPNYIIKFACYLSLYFCLAIYYLFLIFVQFYIVAGARTIELNEFLDSSNLIPCSKYKFCILEIVISIRIIFKTSPRKNILKKKNLNKIDQFQL